MREHRTASAAPHEPMSAPHETTRYFDEHCPEYSPARLDPACRWIADNVPADASLVDVGCGTGNVLAHLCARTGIRDVAGIDPSARSLAVLAERLDCPTYPVSVLDPALATTVDRRFDVVVLAAVLHHLVGRSRRASRELARRGLANALRLARPGGHLIVVEPVFYPPAAMGALFHLKRAVTAVTSRRVELFDTWNNIGAPVVSYLTDEELADFADAAGGEVVATDVRDRRLHPLMRLAGIRRRLEATLVVRAPT